MGRDKVLGLSLGILIIGFAGAFCFRNEPFVENGLKLARAKILDDAIAQRPGPKPYADSKIESPKSGPSAVTLQGIESADPFGESGLALSTPTKTPRPVTETNTRATTDAPSQLTGQLAAQVDTRRPALDRDANLSDADRSDVGGYDAGRAIDRRSDMAPAVAKAAPKTATILTVETYPPKSSAAGRSAAPDRLASAERKIAREGNPEGVGGEKTAPIVRLNPPQIDEDNMGVAAQPIYQPIAGQRELPSRSQCPVDEGKIEEANESDMAALVVHRVQRGDTLTRLARIYLHDGNRYLEIFKANRDQMQSPADLLRIGMKLRIPRNTANPSAPIGRTANGASARGAATTGPTDGDVGDGGLTTGSAAGSRKLVPYRSGSQASRRGRKPSIKNVSRLRETPPKTSTTRSPSSKKNPPRPPVATDEGESTSPSEPTLVPQRVPTTGEDEVIPQSKNRFSPAKKSPFMPLDIESSSSAAPTGDGAERLIARNDRRPDDPSSICAYQFFPRGETPAKTAANEAEPGRAIALENAKPAVRRKTLRALFSENAPAAKNGERPDGNRDEVELHSITELPARY